MACFYRDGSGTWRFKGRAKRRLFRRVRREGLFVRMRLVLRLGRGHIELTPWRRGFPDLCRRRDVRKFWRLGYAYHITLYLRPLNLFGRGALSRIVTFFGQQGVWWGTLPVHWVSSGCVAHLGFGGPLAPIRGDVRFLRGQFGKHPGSRMSVSM